MMTFISSLFQVGIFRKYNFLTSQLKDRKLLVKMNGDILKKYLQTRQSDQAFFYQISDFFYSLKNKLLLFELKSCSYYNQRDAKRLKSLVQSIQPILLILLIQAILPILPILAQ